MTRSAPRAAGCRTDVVALVVNGSILLLRMPSPIARRQCNRPSRNTPKGQKNKTKPFAYLPVTCHHQRVLSRKNCPSIS